MTDFEEQKRLGTDNGQFRIILSELLGYLREVFGPSFGGEVGPFLSPEGQEWLHTRSGQELIHSIEMQLESTTLIQTIDIVPRLMNICIAVGRSIRIERLLQLFIQFCKDYQFVIASPFVAAGHPELPRISGLQLFGRYKLYEHYAHTGYSITPQLSKFHSDDPNLRRHTRIRYRDGIGSSIFMASLVTMDVEMANYLWDEFSDRMNVGRTLFSWIHLVPELYISFACGSQFFLKKLFLQTMMAKTEVTYQFYLDQFDVIVQTQTNAMWTFNLFTNQHFLRELVNTISKLDTDIVRDRRLAFIEFLSERFATQRTNFFDTVGYFEQLEEEDRRAARGSGAKPKTQFEILFDVITSSDMPVSLFIAFPRIQHIPRLILLFVKFYRLLLVGTLKFEAQPSDGEIINIVIHTSSLLLALFCKWTAIENMYMNTIPYERISVMYQKFRRTTFRTHALFFWARRDILMTFLHGDYTESMEAISDARLRLQNKLP